MSKFKVGDTVRLNKYYKDIRTVKDNWVKMFADKSDIEGFFRISEISEYDGTFVVRLTTVKGACVTGYWVPIDVFEPEDWLDSVEIG